MSKRERSGFKLLQVEPRCCWLPRRNFKISVQEREQGALNKNKQTIKNENGAGSSALDVAQ